MNQYNNNYKRHGKWYEEIGDSKYFYRCTYYNGNEIEYEESILINGFKKKYHIR